jgi:crossover junction endodeoxyribonuclease RuvC
MKTYCGVDGGLGGAISIIKNNRLVQVVQMPVISGKDSKSELDIGEIIKYFQSLDEPVIILEKAHAMPKLGSVQAFTFGKNYGLLIGIIATLKIPMVIVHAKTWQKEMFADMSKMDTKQASIIVAQRLYPEFSFKRTEKCKKVDNGFTDATLIATYGARHF